MATREQIQETAREYLGTPFQHQGRIKGHACDCVGLPLMVGDELHLVDKNGKPFKAMDNANYSSQPLDRFVHEEAQRRLIEKPIDQMQPGDMITLRVPSVPCHVAIVTSLQGGLGMIHAYVVSDKVVEHVLDRKWLKRIEGCFEFPGTEE
jgi:NlpC/P60 family putative phage cell wall peptidase